MSYRLIGTLSIALTITLTGCTNQPTDRFSKLEQETSDLCTRTDNFVPTQYMIKVVEVDENGKEVVTEKTVDC